MLPPLIETPITTVKQITNELLDLVAAGAPTPVMEQVVRRRRGERRVDDTELEHRRRQLKITLTKLVRKQEVDVAAVINTLDAARWRYSQLFAERPLKRWPAKLARLKANADRALRDLIQYHRAADQMARKKGELLGLATLDEFMSGESEQLNPLTEPALTYIAAHDLLSRDPRLTPPLVQC